MIAAPPIVETLIRRLGSTVVLQSTRDLIPTVWVKKDQLHKLLSYLKYEVEQPYKMLYDLTAIDERMRGTVWTAGGCQSWYLDDSGRNSVLWPDFTFRFRRRVAHMNPNHYVLTHSSTPTAT